MTACCVYARRKRADLSFKCPNPLRLLNVNSCWGMVPEVEQGEIESAV